MPFDVDVHTGYIVGYHVSESPNLSLRNLRNELPFFLGPNPSEWFPSHLTDAEQSKYTVYKITADIKNVISFNQTESHFSSPYFDLFINISNDDYEYRINPKYSDMLKALNIDMALLIGTKELNEGLILSPMSTIKTLEKVISKNV